MSYPRKLHILVVEDEQYPIDTYHEILAHLETKYPSVAPVVVRSYDDARDYLQSHNVIHLVILDLNLPLETRELPADGIAPGQQLLDLLAKRDAYPIPAVMIVSGKLQLATLTELQERLKTDFWYGAMVNKGDAALASQLEVGMQKVQQYCDVGIHVADSGDDWYPPLTPREEDLLRRCVLSQPSCLSVSLQWWDAESGPSFSRLPEPAGPTKVLMGSFLLDDALGSSRSTFFKFEPSVNAPTTSRDAAILDQKLHHVQVKCMLLSQTRYLLVTQSVADGTPVPLDKYLTGDPAKVIPTLPALIEDIIAQLEKLGRSIDGQTEVRHLLWPWHNRARIVEGLKLSRPQASSADSDTPLQLFDAFAASNQLLWAGKRQCTHGDLNATNVAVDIRSSGRPQAFIFDAAGIHADTDTRDLAMLEVTSLLFNPTLTREFYETCLAPLYGETFIPEGTEHIAAPHSVENSLHFISRLRREVSRQGKSASYALMIFDVILMQLGGLAIQPSRNKIIDRALCRYLVQLVSEWLLRMVPDLAPATSVSTD